MSLRSLGRKQGDVDDMDAPGCFIDIKLPNRRVSEFDDEPFRFGIVLPVMSKSEAELVGEELPEQFNRPSARGEFFGSVRSIKPFGERHVLISYRPNGQLKLGCRSFHLCRRFS